MRPLSGIMVSSNAGREGINKEERGRSNQDSCWSFTCNSSMK